MSSNNGNNNSASNSNNITGEERNLNNTSIELVSNDGPLPINVMMQEGVKALTKILSNQLQDRKVFDNKKPHSMQFVIRNNNDPSNASPKLTQQQLQRKQKDDDELLRRHVQDFIDEEFLDPELRLNGEDTEIIFDYQTDLQGENNEDIGKRISEMIENALPGGFINDATEILNNNAQLHNGPNIKITTTKLKNDHTFNPNSNNNDNIIEEIMDEEELLQDNNPVHTPHIEFNENDDIIHGNLIENDIAMSSATNRNKHNHHHHHQHFHSNESSDNESHMESEVCCEHHPSGYHPGHEPDASMEQEVCCMHHPSGYHPGHEPDSNTNENSVNNSNGHRGPSRFKNYNYHDFNYIPVKVDKPNFSILLEHDKPMCMFCEYYMVFGEPPKNMIKWYNNSFGYSRMPPSRDMHQHHSHNNNNNNSNNNNNNKRNR